MGCISLEGHIKKCIFGLISKFYCFDLIFDLLKPCKSYIRRHCV